MSFLSFFKYVLILYNFLVMTVGGLLLGLAIYFYVDSLQYIEKSFRTWPIYSTFFILIMGLGLLAFIVGFFGCCGACKESSCMLCLYFTIILAIGGLAGAFIFLPDKFELKPHLMKFDLQHDIKEIIQKSYSRYNTSSLPNMIIDKIQEDFQCCGSNNYSDWQFSLQNNSTRPDLGVASSGYVLPPSSGFSNSRTLAPQAQPQNMQQFKPTVTSPFRVPISCCSQRYNEISYSQCKSMIKMYDANPNELQRIPNVNQEGCVEKVYQYLFVTNWWPLNIVGGLALGLTGLSLIFSLCLCCAINRAIDDDDDYDTEGK